MNRNLTAQFILRLQDRASAGLGALQRRLQGIAQTGRRIALFGAIGSGLALAGPISQAAALEGQMRQTAITAGLSGEAVERMMVSNLAMFQTVARETNIRVRDLAGAAGTLVAGGGRAGEVWEQLIPIIGRVASASGANANDLAQTTLAMVNNLRLAPDQVERAFASLVQAGKEGQFELRDMAREFAGLTAAASGIGLRGPAAVNSLAAALQVARQGAGTAGEAATNLTNILQKMTSPDAVRNFREMGVNIERLMEDAGRRGINPLEALIQKIREITGNNMFRVSDLFADSQVLAFLRPMLQQTERYLEVRDRAAAATPALIGTDQTTALRGLAAELQRLTVAWDELTTRLGLSFVGPLRMAGDAVFWISDRLRELEERFPGLGTRLGLFLGGLAAFTAAAGALGFVLGPIAAGFAALSGPVGLAIGLFAAVALAAWQIYENWDGISAWFSGIWRSIGDAASSEWERIRGSEQSAWLMRRVDEIAGVFSGLGTAVAGVGAQVAQGLQQAWDVASQAWLDTPIGRLAGHIATGIREVLALFESLRTSWNEMMQGRAQGDAAAANAGGPALGNVQGRMAAAAAGRAGGFYSPAELAAAANGNAPGSAETRVGGEITVRALPGTEIVDTTSDNSRVPVTTAGDRGATRSRP